LQEPAILSIVHAKPHWVFRKRNRISSWHEGLLQLVIRERPTRPFISPGAHYALDASANAPAMTWGGEVLAQSVAFDTPANVPERPATALDHCCWSFEHEACASSSL
jgi:hypothetical protein